MTTKSYKGPEASEISPLMLKAAVRAGIAIHSDEPTDVMVMLERNALAALDDLFEQLEAAEGYATEGWAWLGAALHALGVSNVFEIPDWKENLRKSNAQMAAEKEVAASYLDKWPE